MTSTFTSAGITLDRYADTLAWLIEQAETQWGDSINTDEDEFLGHNYRVMSTLIAGLNEIVQDLYDSGGVASAAGAALDNEVELIGLDRTAAAKSTTTLSLTSTAATTVPAGSQYKTSAEVVFETDVALVFAAAGTSTVAATCTVTGNNAAAIGTVTTIVTPVYGITTCTNAAAAIPGADRQTDAELKTEHTTAVSTSGEQDTASIYQGIVGVTGVSSAYVYENDKNVAVGVVPARTIRCSVVGGSDADVAASIDNTKTSAVPTYGATSESVYNTTTRQAKDINFDRAVETDTHVAVTVTTTDGIYPNDGDAQVKAAIVAHYDSIDIDEDVDYNALYKPIYTIPGLVVTALTLDTVDPPVGVVTLVSTALIRYVIKTADIDVTS